MTGIARCRNPETAWSKPSNEKGEKLVNISISIDPRVAMALVYLLATTL
jgi:hypothetical protein